MSGKKIGHYNVGQISLKPCLPSRGHTFVSIFMKLNLNVCLDDISIKFEYESSPLKIKMENSGRDLFQELW